jgi:predicted transcriptional regulator of viral defense system
MKLIDAHARLSNLTVPTFTTNEAAAWLRIDRNHASQVLARLARSKHVAKLARGRWALPERITPFMLPEALTAPKPSYVSLYSALHEHGMIEQIPDIVYAVTLAPTQLIRSPLGAVSLHHVAPRFFFGYELIPSTGVKLASPEKALLDVLYLRPARSRLFRALPELELPRSFSKARALAMLPRIASPARRSLVRQQLETVLADARALSRRPAR